MAAFYWQKDLAASNVAVSELCEPYSYGVPMETTIDNVAVSELCEPYSYGVPMETTIDNVAVSELCEPYSYGVPMETTIGNDGGKLQSSLNYNLLPQSFTIEK